MRRHGLARAALEAGKKRFFTGEPCIRGHIAERIVSSGQCIECQKIFNYKNVKKWRKENPEKRAMQSKRYAEKHPDVKRKAVDKYRTIHADRIRVEQAERARRIRKAYPEKERERVKRWAAKREARLAAIAGRARQMKCEICDADGITVFDHCHTHGHFRGWICDRCNKMLGLVKDSIPLLYKLAGYLEKSGGKVISIDQKQIA